MKNVFTIHKNDNVAVALEQLEINDTVSVNHTAGTLESMHGKATQLFRSAITNTLHNAMNPTTI